PRTGGDGSRLPFVPRRGRGCARDGDRWRTGARRHRAARAGRSARVSSQEPGGGTAMSDTMLDYAAIERELVAFEAEERRKLGLDEAPPAHWRDANPQAFTRADRETTTILLGGLTLAHDTLITGALA